MRGVAVLCLSLGACSSSNLSDISDADARACAELIAALPEEVAGEALSTDSDRTASWGGVELTCGAELPAAYDEIASCSVVGDVGWFLPPSELSDPTSDIVATALTHDPRVSVLIPVDARGTDEVQAAIAPAILETLTEGKPCF